MQHITAHGQVEILGSGTAGPDRLTAMLLVDTTPRSQTCAVGGPRQTGAILKGGFLQMQEGSYISPSAGKRISVSSGSLARLAHGCTNMRGPLLHSRRHTRVNTFFD